MPRRLVRVEPAPVKSKSVCVRLTPDEYVEAEAMAAAHGLPSVPDLLRKCLLAVQLDEAKRETR